MGMQIFEKSGTFNPADWGLGAGDMVQVVCVGGGCSGDLTIVITNTDKSIQGKSGGNSSFGTYVVAFGGSQMDYKICMGIGGKAAYDYERSNDIFASAGGAGGYMIGIPFYGGNGGDGWYTRRETTMPVPITYNLPTGLGASGYMNAPSGYYEFAVGLPYANLHSYRGGNKGAGLRGGNGYGAGGGNNGRVLDTTTPAFTHGGNSGQIKIETVKLISNDQIQVTVGAGGESNTYSDLYGNYTSGKGADGVVVVTW